MASRKHIRSSALHDLAAPTATTLAGVQPNRISARSSAARVREALARISSRFSGWGTHVTMHAARNLFHSFACLARFSKSSDRVWKLGADSPLSSSMLWGGFPPASASTLPSLAGTVGSLPLSSDCPALIAALQIPRTEKRRKTSRSVVSDPTCRSAIPAPVRNSSTSCLEMLESPSILEDRGHALNKAITE